MNGLLAVTPGGRRDHTYPAAMTGSPFWRRAPRRSLDSADARGRMNIISIGGCRRARVPGHERLALAAVGIALHVQSINPARTGGIVDLAGEQDEPAQVPTSACRGWNSRARARTPIVHELQQRRALRGYHETSRSRLFGLATRRLDTTVFSALT